MTCKHAGVTVGEEVDRAAALILLVPARGLASIAT